MQLWYKRVCRFHIDLTWRKLRLHSQPDLTSSNVCLSVFSSVQPAGRAVVFSCWKASGTFLTPFTTPNRWTPNELKRESERFRAPPDWILWKLMPRNEQSLTKFTFPAVPIEQKRRRKEAFCSSVKLSNCPHCTLSPKGLVAEWRNVFAICSSCRVHCSWECGLIVFFQINCCRCRLVS